MGPYLSAAAWTKARIWSGWATSQVAMERALGAWPLPGRYDADAPVKLRRAPRAAAGGAAHTHGAEAAR